MSTARENILNKIKKALDTPVPLPFPGVVEPIQNYVQEELDPTQIFINAFTGIQGNLVYCDSEVDRTDTVKALLTSKGWEKIYAAEPTLRTILSAAGYEQWEELSTCDVSFTTCEALVARTGTIILSAALEQGRTASVYAPVHVCIAYTSQIQTDLKEGFEFLLAKYDGNLPSFITFASGPSRTADIEKTLVTGVHGPKEVYCLLINDLPDN